MTRKRKNGNGNNGQYTSTNKINKEFKAKTDGQAEYVRAMIESDITICTGPAGTGKTACAVGLACEYLQRDKVQYIVVCRPVVETGRTGLGFLPGDMEQKIHPYMVPVLDEMYLYLGRANTENKQKSGYIRIVPLEYMRGYNLHNSFIILDEAQNATKKQIKMLMTRIGRDSKLVLAGDITQNDFNESITPLQICTERFVGVRGVSIVELHQEDIIRNKIIWRILEKIPDF